MVGQSNPASLAFDDEVGSTAGRGVLHLLAHAQELGALELDLFRCANKKAKAKGRQPDRKNRCFQGLVAAYASEAALAKRAPLDYVGSGFERVRLQQYSPDL